VQATAAEALAGLVRGAGVWPLAEQQQLWELVAAPLPSMPTATPLAARAAPVVIVTSVPPRSDGVRAQWSSPPRDVQIVRRS